MKQPDGLLNSYQVNLQAPLQIVDDWSKEWITDVQVIDRTEKCPEGWVKLFDEGWNGYKFNGTGWMGDNNIAYKVDVPPWENSKNDKSTFINKKICGKLLYNVPKTKASYYGKTHCQGVGSLGTTY